MNSPALSTLSFQQQQPQPQQKCPFSTAFFKRKYKFAIQCFEFHRSHIIIWRGWHLDRFKYQISLWNCTIAHIFFQFDKLFAGAKTAITVNNFLLFRRFEWKISINKHESKPATCKVSSKTCFDKYFGQRNQNQCRALKESRQWELRVSELGGETLG